MSDDDQSGSYERDSDYVADRITLDRRRPDRGGTPKASGRGSSGAARGRPRNAMPKIAIRAGRTDTRPDRAKVPGAAPPDQSSGGARRIGAASISWDGPTRPDPIRLMKESHGIGSVGLAP